MGLRYRAEWNEWRITTTRASKGRTGDMFAQTMPDLDFWARCHALCSFIDQGWQCNECYRKKTFFFWLYRACIIGLLHLASSPTPFFQAGEQDFLNHMGDLKSPLLEVATHVPLGGLTSAAVTWGGYVPYPSYPPALPRSPDRILAVKIEESAGNTPIRMGGQYYPPAHSS